MRIAPLTLITLVATGLAWNHACLAQPGCTSYVPPAVLDGNPAPATQATAGTYLAADPQTVILGDPNYRPDINSSPGRAQVFHLSGAVWSLETTLGPQTLGTDGIADVSGDLLCITDLAGLRRIAVYQRTPSASGATWNRLGLLPVVTGGGFGDAQGSFAMTSSLVAVIRVPHASPASIDFFEPDAASLVRLSRTSTLATGMRDLASPVRLAGDTLVVHAVPSTAAADRIEIFTRLASGWAWTQTISAPPGIDYQTRFGQGLALAGDMLAIGLCVDPTSQPGFVSNASGHVLLYQRTTVLGQPDQWLPAGTIEPPNAGSGGFGAAIAGSSTQLAIAAQLENRTGPHSGCVHLYQRQGGAWTYSGALSVPDGAAQFIGFAVSMAGGTVVASATGYMGHGGAYVFDPCSQPPSGGSTPRCLPGVFGLVTFVNSWFAGNLFADFNLNGHLEVQDIFDFLTAWFAGCP